MIRDVDKKSMWQRFKHILFLYKSFLLIISLQEYILFVLYFLLSKETS